MNRRTMLTGAATAVAAGSRRPDVRPPRTRRGSGAEILGQGTFRYREVIGWGRLDRAKVPVKDCHAITENRDGQIVLLTNDKRNNIITYTKDGTFVAKREDRFPAAHALEFQLDRRGDEVLWVTDHQMSVISLLTPDGREEQAPQRPTPWRRSIRTSRSTTRPTSP